MHPQPAGYTSGGHEGAPRANRLPRNRAYRPDSDPQSAHANESGRKRGPTVHATETTQTACEREDDDPPRPGVNPGPFPSEMAVRRAGMARPHVGLTSGANIDALASQGLCPLQPRPSSARLLQLHSSRLMAGKAAAPALRLSLLLSRTAHRRAAVCLVRCREHNLACAGREGEGR